MNQFSVESPLFTPEEAAQYLRISVRKIHQLVRSNKLRCVQESRRDRRFTLAHMDTYIDSVDIVPSSPLPSSLKGGDGETKERKKRSKSTTDHQNDSSLRPTTTKEVLALCG